jgi:glycosyltransferase involved in cell wall biosynthesis
MKLILICHPSFSRSQSMPRFAGMLKAAYAARGHSVEVWAPSAKVYNWVPPGRLSRWAGYVDQYLLFPMAMRSAVTRAPKDTLFVFCDQALGPWVPVVRHRPHVVHVHDLLALRSALGEIPENPTSITGRIYQRYIRRGFRKARHFISISRKTQADLHRVGGVSAITSEVVYNGLNFPFSPLAYVECQKILSGAGLPVPASGMLLHVGGGQWYKNLPGVIHLYAHYAAEFDAPLPLWCVSPEPNSAVHSALRKVPAAGKVLFFNKLESRVLQAAYSMADALLFPSLAEGFGWPLIEAQACGCPVVTTDEAPMNEVGGDAAQYLPRLTAGGDIDAWASNGARQLIKVLSRTLEDKRQFAERAVKWSSHFSVDKAIDSYLTIYENVLSLTCGGHSAAAPFNERVKA